MPPRTDIILWLDLETTGSADDAEIIEIGMAVTNTELTVLHEFQSVVRGTPLGKARVDANPVVLGMHKSTGLYDEVWNKPQPSLDEVRASIDAWLKLVRGSSTSHIPFAGSGVMHFDRKYIRRDFPVLDKSLTYWAYDVGVVRRVINQLAKVTVEQPATNRHKTHRALDDVRAAIDEMKLYVQLLRANDGS